MNKEQTPRHIIRGVQVEGIAFLDPNTKTVSELSQEIRAQSQAKMKEVLHHKKDISRDHPEELEEIWKEGENEGYRRGLLEGQKQGYDIGREEGLETGFREGMDKTRQELQKLLQLVNSVAMGLAVKQEGIFEQIKPEIITFILTICEHVLRRTLSDSKIFIGLIERLLVETKLILKDGNVKVVLSPDDLMMLDHYLKSIVYDKEEISKLQFVSDKNIENGNCRIETSLGLINFDIKRIMGDLEKKVLEVDVEETADF